MNSPGGPIKSCVQHQFRHLPSLHMSLGWILVVVVILSLTWISLPPAWAADGGLDPTFNPGVGVQKIPIIRGQTDYLNSGGTATTGVSLIFGYFTSVTDSAGTHNVSSIAKLNDTSGMVDTNFNIPVVGEVRGAMLLNPTSPTSSIVFWGQFSLTSGGTTYYNLARLYWNGLAYAVDNGFPHIFNLVDTHYGIPVSMVSTVAVQASTGNILVGGFNMQVQGDTTHAYHLIRVSPTWIYDSAYSAANPARALPGGVVNYINLWDVNFSNKARIFGTLPKSGGGCDYMQLTGTDLSTIEASLSNSQLDGPISMTQSAAGQPWLIWGMFKTAFGTAIKGVAVLKSDLSGLDNTTFPYASFNSGIINGGGPDHWVFSGFMQGDGKVVLAGNLTSFNTTPCGHLVRLNTNGTVDTSFNTSGSGLDDRPFRLYKPAGSTNFQITGAFRNYNGAGNPRGGIVSLDLNGNLLGNYASVTANSNTPGAVYANEMGIIGGDFTGVGGKYHQNLARLNYDGSTDHSFVCNVEGVVDTVRAMESGLLISGNFAMALGVGRTSLVRLNVDYSHYPTLTFSLDNSFNPALTKANGTVAGIRGTDVDDSGLIMVMGHLDKVNGSDRTAIARLFSTGALDTTFTFNPGSLQGFTNIRINAGGNMGGVYPIVGKATYQNLPYGFGARLLHNGALDTSFATGQSPVPNALLFNREAFSGGGLPDGRIFVCGDFTHVNDGTNFTIPRGGIARFSANGVLDTTWVPAGANGPIISLDIQPNGKILIGGLFTTYNSTARNNVARLNPNGSLDTGFNPGTGTDGPVVLVFYDWQNRVMINGGFTHYNGSSRPGIARIFSAGNAFTPAILYLLLLQ